MVSFYPIQLVIPFWLSSIYIYRYEWHTVCASTQLSNIRDELFKEFRFAALENIMYHVYLLKLCAYSLGNRTILRMANRFSVFDLIFFNVLQFFPLPLCLSACRFFPIPIFVSVALKALFTFSHMNIIPNIEQIYGKHVQFIYPRPKPRLVIFHLYFDEYMNSIVFRSLAK